MRAYSLMLNEMKGILQSGIKVGKCLLKSSSTACLLVGQWGRDSPKFRAQGREMRQSAMARFIPRSAILHAQSLAEMGLGWGWGGAILSKKRI
jgi:hypothetical protein